MVKKLKKMRLLGSSSCLTLKIKATLIYTSKLRHSLTIFTSFNHCILPRIDLQLREYVTLKPI